MICLMSDAETGSGGEDHARRLPLVCSSESLVIRPLILVRCSLLAIQSYTQSRVYSRRTGVSLIR